MTLPVGFGSGLNIEQTRMLIENIVFQHIEANAIIIPDAVNGDAPRAGNIDQAQ